MKRGTAGESGRDYGNLWLYFRGIRVSNVKVYGSSRNLIFLVRKKKKKKRKTYEGKKIQEFAELKPGDYVVHENHGLGIYQGIEKVEVDTVTRVI